MTEKVVALLYDVDVAVFYWYWTLPLTFTTVRTCATRANQTGFPLFFRIRSLTFIAVRMVTKYINLTSHDLISHY